ncbi:MAG TPA: phage major capsid protein [Bacteroidales bacterium]|nr:phage major capsid protein [Bacteroidales bacterium]
MNEQELKALQDQIKAELKTIKDANAALTAALETKAPVEKIEELINKANAGEISVKKLSDQLDALELSMKDVKLGNQIANPFADFKKVYDEKGKASAKAPGGQFVFELKGNPRMLFKAHMDEDTNLTDAIATAVVVPMRTPGVEKLPDRQVLILDAVARGVTASNRVTWVERSARTDATAPVAEGVTYAQSAFTYIMKVAEVEKIGTFIKVTNECLEDWPEFLTQIRNELLPMVERELEDQTYQGSGTTPQLDGIITTANAYSSTSLDDKIPKANTFDAIRAAANQIAEYNFIPSVAFLAPADFAELEMTKDDQGRYVMPPFSTANGTTVAGIRIVQSNLITVGDVLVGDFKKVTLYIKRGIEVKIWDQDSTDPELDLKTITASVRAAVKFPLPSRSAFVYDAISDITSAILAV